MSFTRNTPYRQFEDANLSASVALPNAANTANTAGIDLSAKLNFPVNEDFQVKLSISGGTSANTKNLTVVVQGSDDNSSFSTIAGTPSLVVQGVSTAYPATSMTFNLPPGFNKRYLRASVTGEANGGDPSATGTLKCQAVF